MQQYQWVNVDLAARKESLFLAVCHTISYVTKLIFITCMNSIDDKYSSFQFKCSFYLNCVALSFHVVKIIHTFEMRNHKNLENLIKLIHLRFVWVMTLLLISVKWKGYVFWVVYAHRWWKLLTYGRLKHYPWNIVCKSQDFLHFSKRH